MTEAVDRLRAIADYQFGPGAGRAIFPPGEDRTIQTSASGRVRQVAVDDAHIVTLGTDGRFTLGLGGGRRLVDAIDPPRGRVVVGDESEPFVREGRSVFAKFVQVADPRVRARDEVAITHESGALLGVGHAELDAGAMASFTTGVAVSTRDGAEG
ncbi:MAG: PUA domain-containing protein [Halobacteriaceae archaeon]